MFLDRKTEDNKNKNLQKSNIKDRRQRRMARRGSGTKSDGKDSTCTAEKICGRWMKIFVERKRTYYGNISNYSGGGCIL